MLTILLAAHSLDDYSLDDYLSFTSRTQLVGSGSRVAWVERVRGVPNLAGSEDGGPSFQLTNFTGDDGLDIGGLVMTAKGDLVWAMGPVDAANQRSAAVLPVLHKILTTPFRRPLHQR